MAERDGVDVILEQWRRERPELDPSPIGVIGRISRLARELEQRLEAVYREHGLEPGWHDVLATLRRTGPPYQLRPTDFAGTLMLTSSGTTKRLDRLEQAGLITRAPDPEDRRGTLITLTEAGHRAHRRRHRGAPRQRARPARRAHRRRAAPPRRPPAQAPARPAGALSHVPSRQSLRQRGRPRESVTQWRTSPTPMASSPPSCARGSGAGGCPPAGPSPSSSPASAAGTTAAFEALYDAYHRRLLAFCQHMLGSREEAEDVLQHTFLAAYRSLRAGYEVVDLKPWLYTIARNRCLSVMRARREEVELDEGAPATEGLAAEVDRRADLRMLVRDVQRLPPDQRAALVLFEVGDHSHKEIAAVLGVRREKVKALVFQAREALMGWRTARETPCAHVREQLATLRGRALGRGTIRRHVELCAGCADYEAAVRCQRAALAIALPVVAAPPA